MEFSIVFIILVSIVLVLDFSNLVLKENDIRLLYDLEESVDSDSTLDNISTNLNTEETPIDKDIELNNVTSEDNVTNPDVNTLADLDYREELPQEQLLDYSAASEAAERLIDKVYLGG